MNVSETSHMNGAKPGLLQYGTAGIRQEAVRCAGSKSVPANNIQRPAHSREKIHQGRAGFPVLLFSGICIRMRTTKREYRTVQKETHREECS